MKSLYRVPRLWGAALFLVLALVTAACGGGGGEEAASPADTTSSATEEMSESEMMSESETMSESEMASESEMMSESEMGSESEMAALPAGCQGVPTDSSDEGSLEGMADDPVGTAASNNPVLTTLVQAVMAANLVDTLNDTSASYTVFAPTNDAFAKIPADQLQAVLADTDLLTQILTLHVVPERLDSEALATRDSLPTANGAEITIAASGDTLEVNGQAQVICPDVMTANATVHLIDTVLMPS